MAKTAGKRSASRKSAGPHFGEKGQAFWDEVLAKFDPSIAERRTLEDACREIDLVERLQVELDAGALIVSGSQGQPVSSPLVQEIRQHRAVLDRLLKSLKFGDEPAAEEERSVSARERALRRWSA